MKKMYLSKVVKPGNYVAYQLDLEGLDMDTVYENFVRQIAGKLLQSKEVESLKATIEREEKINRLKKQIEVLQAKIRKEKQLNVQMKYSVEMKKLRNELQKIDDCG